MTKGGVILGLALGFIVLRCGGATQSSNSDDQATIDVVYCKLQSVSNSQCGGASQFSIDEDIAPPQAIAFPSGGLFGQPVQVTFLSNEPATIYYTLDGSNPTNASTQWSGGILNITSETTLKFLAVDSSGNQGEIRTATYNFESATPTVVLTDIQGYFNSLSTFTVNASGQLSVDWTVDLPGSYEAEVGKGYLGGGNVFAAGTASASNTTVLTGSLIEGGRNNLFISVTAGGKQGYALVEVLKDDAFPIIFNSLADGLYNGPRQMTLSFNKFSKIFFTTDGSTPDENSTEYLAPQLYGTTPGVVTNEAIQAVAIDLAGNTSPVYSYNYTFDPVGPVVIVSNPASKSMFVSGGGGVIDASIDVQADQDSSYMIEIGGDGTLGSGTQVLSGSYTTPSTDINLVVSGTDLSEGTNEVFLIFQDEAGNSGFDKVTVEKDASASTPVAVYPQLGENIKALPVTFEWSDVTTDASEASGFDRYELEIAQLPGFSTLVYSTTIAATGGNNQHTINSSLLQGKYYWRVRFVDAVGNYSDYSTRSFYFNDVKNDISNDNFSDVAIGSPNFGASLAGRVDIFLGKATPSPSADIILEGTLNNQQFGFSVDIVDVNDDGFGDVIVGAPYYTQASQFDIGRVYIFSGATIMANCAAILPAQCTLNDVTADLTIIGESAGDLFGWAIDDATGVNIDNYGDFIVGAPRNDQGGTDAGKAYLMLGGATFQTSFHATYRGSGNFEELGLNVAAVSDVNGNGQVDLVFSAPKKGMSVMGTNYSTTGSATLLTLDISSGQLVQLSEYAKGGNGTQFGRDIAGGFDLNRDGFADFVVGGPLDSSTNTLGGGVRLIFGGESDHTLNFFPLIALGSITAQDIDDGSNTAQFGFSSAMMSNLNAGGDYAWVSCAPHAFNGTNNAGRCFRYKTLANGSVQSLETIGGSSLNEELGYRVQNIGDFNNDGFYDLVITARRKTVASLLNVGEARLLLGSAGFTVNQAPAVVWQGVAQDQQFGTSLAGD